MDIKKSFLGVESKPRFPRGRIGTMAGKTVVRQDGANVSVELNGARLLGLLGPKREQATTEDQRRGKEPTSASSHATATLRVNIDCRQGARTDGGGYRPLL